MSLPQSFRLYHQLRGALTPSYTIKYLLLEGLFSTVILGVIPRIPLSTALLIGGGQILFVLAIISSVKQQRRRDESVLLTQPLSRFATSAGIAVVPSVLYGLLSTSQMAPYNSSISTTVVVLYVVLLYHRGQKYRGERQFFTNEQSQNAREWYNASVAFEQGIYHFDSQNQYRAYHWLKKATESYEYFEECSGKERHRRVAHELGAASKLLLEGLHTQKQADFWETYENHLAAAIDAKMYARCDVCNRMRRIDECHRLTDENGVEQEILCGRCHFQRKRPGPTAENPNETDTETEQSSKKNNTTKDKKRTSQKSHNESYSQSSGQSKHTYKTNNKSPEMSVSEACDKLGIQPPLDADSIKTAFRKKVKEVHPDMGGSDDEFKEVQKARERLETEIG